MTEGKGEEMAERRIPTAVIVETEDLDHSTSGEVTYFPITINDDQANAQYPFPRNYMKTTKYTLGTFFPKNLFEQFRRFTNVFFLIVTIITCIPQISPIEPITSVLPLLFVLGVSIIKEGFEDYKRYQADSIVNNELFDIVKGPESVDVPTKSCDIRVGNVLHLKKEQRIPADVIIFTSSMPEGMCHVETSQLDGETNLKPFQAPAYTSDWTTNELSNLGHGIIICEEPNPDLYKFNGRIVFTNGDTVPLNEKQLLLQGACVRNTDDVYGVVIHTGYHTKLALNQKNPPSKFSQSEVILNKFVVGVFCFLILLCIIASMLSWYHHLSVEDHWYITGGGSAENHGVFAVKSFFCYFALLSWLIPMSMMVTLEVVKFIQTFFMDWDKEMEIEEPSVLDPSKMVRSGMLAKTSNLNDELALVRWVFSDKTGTLTENKMIFSRCSVAGTIFELPFEGELNTTLLSKSHSKKFAKASFDPLAEFLYCLCLCHTVVPEVRGTADTVQYQAQSPDEAALCHAAKANSFDFVRRTHKTMTILRNGVEEVFMTLAVMEFTSERRRMSILVRTPEGHVCLYTKGADTVMLEMLADTRKNEKQKGKLQDDLEHFSQLGLRTLVLAFKEVDEVQFQDWYSRYDLALSFVGPAKADRIDALHRELERDLHLLGCTAIEDKLQDGVPEAIRNLLLAGVRLWVITGDKQETAINIGYSSKLLRPSSKLVIVNATTQEECGDLLQKAVNSCEASQDVGLVLNGNTVELAVEHFSHLLMALAEKCHSVICCRVTPLQKALIVHCVKKQSKDVTLSIGDGANDVSMIQTAHIGIGIYGKEGTQAARASDYAVRQFRHLNRLLMVHGRFSLLRNAMLIKFSFYKNMAFFLVNFWFGIFNQFSCQKLYDDWMMTFFNIFITFFPPLFIGLVESDLSTKDIKKYPQAFARLSTGCFFNVRSLACWLFVGVWHSLVFFFSIYGLFRGNNVLDPSGRVNGLWLGWVYLNTLAVITILTKLCIRVRAWNWVIFLSLAFSFSVYFVFLFFESVIPHLSSDFQLYWAWPVIFSQLPFYLTVVIIPFFILLPDFLYEFIQRRFKPQDWQIIQEIGKSSPKTTEEMELEDLPQNSPLVSRRSKEYFQE